MSRKGGYLIIDLKNNDLMDSPTIEGIYDLIEGNYGKSILLSGIMINEVEKADVFTKPDVSSSTFVFKNVYGYDISVNDEDEVTIASTEVATRAWVETIVEGGTLDNAKPIYCHPIRILNSGTTIYACAFLIFNNDSTPFTMDTLQSYLVSLYNSVESEITIMLDGAYSNGNVSLILSHLFYNGVFFGVAGVKSDYSGRDTVSGSTLVEVFAGENIFTDAVNKIN